jgi:hypothetical protein
MSNLYRGPSIDASIVRFLKQFSSETAWPNDMKLGKEAFMEGLVLAKQFQRRRFLEIDQSKTRIACGSHVC